MALRTPPLYLQAGSHSAENDRLVGIRGMVGTAGVSIGTNDFLVSQSGTPGMSVQVATGWAWILGSTTSTQGMYATYNDAATTLTISTADPTNPRIDVILQVITGTPAASPSAPATPASSLVLATVAVAAGATSILNANITDARTRAALALTATSTGGAGLQDMFMLGGM